MLNIKKSYTLTLVLISVYSLAYSHIVEFNHLESSVKVASFGVFSSDFDTFVNPMYYSDTSNLDYLNVYAGVSKNYYNVGFSGKAGKDDQIFYSGVFFEKIANWGAWPNNHTDLGTSLTGSFYNWAIQLRYLDFCYGGGKAYIDPGATISKIFETGNSYKLRTSLAMDYFIRYWKSNKKDAFMPKITLAIDFSEDSSNGFGIEYNYVHYTEGFQNVTDLSDCPDTHRIYAWGGKTFDLDENITVGVKPSAFVTLNAVNPTKSIYNCYSEYWNNEFHAIVPFAVKYNFDEKLEIYFSVFIGQYYSTFNHLYYTGLGGSNKKGWVTENGVGIGVNLKLEPKCTVQIGSQFVSMPEYAGDSNGTNYEYNNISASNIADAPLSFVIQIKM